MLLVAAVGGALAFTAPEFVARRAGEKFDERVGDESDRRSELAGERC